MIETPQIVKTTAHTTAVIHVVVPRDEIQLVMGPGIGELMSTIATQGISPVGPWFTHHCRRPTDTFDFEISVPVSRPVTAEGRVKPSQWPEMTVAQTIYSGPYDGLAEAWGEFRDWIDSNGHKAGNELWERYLVGPESSPDPASWRTELNWPLLVK